MGRHGVLTLRTYQVVKRAWNGASLEGLRNFFYEICQKGQLWNMDKTGFIQKQNSCTIVVSKDSSNVCSKCADANFHTTFAVCVSAAKSVTAPLLILPGKRLNRDVIEGFDIEGANITTAPILFNQFYFILKLA